MTRMAAPNLAAELRAELDDVLAGLAAEAGDCDPDDGWYPDTSELEDLLDEVADLVGQAPAVAHTLAGHVATRIRAVLAAGHCLTADLDDALARAEELRDSLDRVRLAPSVPRRVSGSRAPQPRPPRVRLPGAAA